MNRLEYLLTCVMEEAAEMQQMAAKSQRFGLDSFNPYEPKQANNEFQLLKEFEELKAVMEMLQPFTGKLPDGHAQRIRDEKKERVEKFILISKELGNYHD